MTKSLSIKITQLTAVFLGLFLFTNCGEEIAPVDSQDVVVNDDYYEFQDFIMEEYDIPGVISLPDETANIGASTKPEVKHDESFKWEINAGQKFQVQIEDW